MRGLDSSARIWKDQTKKRGIIIEILIGYILFISIIGVIAVLYDNWASKGDRLPQVPEQALLLVGLFGGSLAILLTLLITGHRTPHRTFLVGLVIILVLQIALIIFLWQGGHLN